MMQRSTILVTGATGNVGRHVVSQLLDTGAAVRAVSRSPDSAGLPGGVETGAVDLSRPETLEASLDGVEAVFLLLTGQTYPAAPEIVAVLARHASRVVLLSSSRVRDDLDEQIDPMGAGNAANERLVQQSGLEWTFLRPTVFAANALAWRDQIRAEGVVRGAYAASAGAPIHERDTAAVAVRALTGDGHSGKKYALSGPETLTQAEQVRILGEVIGRPLRFEEISREAVRRQMSAAMPAPFVEGLLDIQAEQVTKPEPITNTVEEITGTPARSFRDWAIDHADDFRQASARQGA